MNNDTSIEKLKINGVYDVILIALKVAHQEHLYGVVGLPKITH